MSERISAAECPASARREEEWRRTPAVAFMKTSARLTSLQKLARRQE
jgi:hypothetical protein